MFKADIAPLSDRRLQKQIIIHSRIKADPKLNVVRFIFHNLLSKYHAHYNMKHT